MVWRKCRPKLQVKSPRYRKSSLRCNRTWHPATPRSQIPWYRNFTSIPATHLVANTQHNAAKCKTRDDKLDGIGVDIALFTTYPQSRADTNIERGTAKLVALNYSDRVQRHR
ncbi:hypothetical protein CB0940_05197 [Cercospora beticola]|uniref:Uncharacterized protein n=1 Tax=Cercospora beticola TaxID=122368 RepID=A0A2G5HMM2_CERBT|nr:hypothetical protein CB0940_05197 [Cercospora beticola]PIA93748.1 hypothetical protein CB0940_05197 [Cercospora beticola]CAK1362593.1 unnamed protein product [Cercospora beticola]